MNKLLILLQILAMAFCYAATANASGGHGKGHHKFKNKHRKEIVHYYVPVAPPPPARHYSAPVPTPPQPYYPQQDRRSVQGLTGGVVGSALGYQLGNGSPLTTGVGAAAGALIGNEIAK
ncbi:MAG: glycine zipper 2TM domain-containing protein [Gammaproteobacteria bacterium]